MSRDRQAYGFTYDGLDRLTEAKYFDITGTTSSPVYSTDNKFKEAIQYDLRGNILGLQRNGYKNGAWTSNNYTAAEYGQIDNLVYGYNTKNQLIQMIDNAVNPNVPNAGKDYKGFVYDFAVGTSGSDHYAYDNNGNLTKDAHKDILTITYNYLNLPQVITLTAGRTIQFVYDATGAKLKKITNDNGVVTTFDYINGVEYKNDVLQRIAHTEGSVVKNEFGAYEHEYVLRDHLGNSRVAFRDGINKGDAYFDWNTWQYIDPNAGNTTGLNDGIITAADIKQVNHYYAFGLNMEGNWQGGVAGTNKYQYGGKELNDDFGLNWNDYGARFYDPAMARWTTADPMADFRSWVSPYQYVQNNPISRIDPTGMLDQTQEQKDKQLANAVSDNGKWLNESRPDGGYWAANQQASTITMSGDRQKNKSKDGLKGMYVFDENGKYLKFIATGKPVVIKIGDIIYDFNDPNTDVGSIIYNSKKSSFDLIKFIYTLSAESIEAMMEVSGADYGTSRIIVLAKSVGGKFDFSVFHLGVVIGRQGGKGMVDYWSTDEILQDRGPLFLMPNSNIVYNLLDAGNWLWGYAMHRMGYSLDDALKYSKKYDPKDPGADQKAITAGWNTFTNKP